MCTLRALLSSAQHRSTVVTDSTQRTTSVAPLVSVGKARVLLVDDHPANLVALEAILEPLGQELVRANSGEEALKHLLHGDFAAILLDVQMPGLDGFQTAALVRARERSRNIPIIFLTAYSKEPQHVFRGYRQGAVDYLVKPFDPDILRSKVQVFIELYLAKEQVKVQAEQLLVREREASERKSAERHQQLMDLMPQCVWASRPDGSLYLVNRVWTSYSGMTLEQTKDGGYLEAVHPDDRARVGEAWERSVKSGQRFQVEYRFRRASDGEYRWFLGRAIPERDGSGGILSWVGTATDIEDHKRDQAALTRANEAKDAFIAAASHELRTPLAAAKAQTQLALRRMGPEGEPKAMQALEVIGRQIDRMGKLVEDLLDVSRLATGRLSLELAPFDVGERLRETVERVQALTDKHQIEVIAPERATMVGDRDRIEQVFTNLLTNAVRYSPAGGVIHAALEQEPGFVHVWVRDHGLGIPLDKQSMIFEQFARAHGNKYGGLGLGLAITRGIVMQHGGELWVESAGEPGEGSTFHVRMPRTPPERQSINGVEEAEGVEAASA